MAARHRAMSMAGLHAVRPEGCRDTRSGPEAGSGSAGPPGSRASAIVAGRWGFADAPAAAIDHMALRARAAAEEKLFPRARVAGWRRRRRGPQGAQVRDDGPGL